MSIGVVAAVFDAVGIAVIVVIVILFFDLVRRFRFVVTGRVFNSFPAGSRKGLGGNRLSRAQALRRGNRCAILLEYPFGPARVPVCQKRGLGGSRKKNSLCEWAVIVLEHCDFVVFSNSRFSRVGECN